jgi:hypothetical protein
MLRNSYISVIRQIYAEMLVRAVFCALAGTALLERESWGRPLVLLIAIISLINAPFGTALGAYTLPVEIVDN